MKRAMSWPELVTDLRSAIEHACWRDAWRGPVARPEREAQDRRITRDARWLLAAHRHAGGPVVTAELLADLWGVSVQRARGALVEARAGDTDAPEAAPVRRAAPQPRDHAAERAQRRRVWRYALEEHDAWLDDVRVAGRLVTFEHAAMDLPVLRWRAREGLMAEPTLDDLGRRWGWSRPRADIQPFVAGIPRTPGIPYLPAEGSR